MWGDEMRKQLAIALGTLLLVAAAALASGPEIPPFDSGGGSGTGCQACSRDLYTASCDAPQSFSEQRWANCQGGMFCYWDAIQGWKCEPDCGGTRCYIV